MRWLFCFQGRFLLHISTGVSGGKPFFFTYSFFLFKLLKREHWLTDWLTHWLVSPLLMLYVSLFDFIFFLPPQRSSRAAAEILEFPPTGSGKAWASATATDSTSSACPPSSWWARRTSPARKTTSGPRRSPAASVGPPVLRRLSYSCAPHVRL